MYEACEVQSIHLIRNTPTHKKCILVNLFTFINDFADISAKLMSKVANDGKYDKSGKDAG